MTERGRDEGYDDWLDALEEGAPYYLSCSAGHGSLPPRRRCPDCGSGALDTEPLPETGTVETFSVTHVPTPSFADDAPYVVAIVDFGPVRLTGHLRGIEFDAVESGTTVSAAVERAETTDERLLVFRPR